MIDFPESDEELERLPEPKVVDYIVSLTSALARFWTRAHGWAPPQTAEALSRARLDWQASLAGCLHARFRELAESEEAGNLILAWVNLGCLVEGTLMLFISVYREEYREDELALKRDGLVVEPNRLNLEHLRQFLVKKGLLEPEWDAYVQLIQQRRNAVHSFRGTFLGDRDEFVTSVRKYLVLLRHMNSGLPYPDWPSEGEA